MRSAEGLPRVRIHEDAERVARAAAALVVEASAEASETSGRFSIALAGGSTPKRVYELLASEEFGAQVDWNTWHVFFGDERCVPPDDPESNYRMANETLLARVPIPRENIHRIRGEGDAVANARVYEDELRGYFVGETWPAFDLVLLGMGDDGHTASLFPGTDALREQDAWVTANWVERLNQFRITLTVPAINHAERVAFVVTGGAKSARLREVLRDEGEPARLPAQLIKPASGRLAWLVDEAAAAGL